MTNNDSQAQNTSILAALDQLIDAGAWNESTFFRVMGNQLRNLREKFSNYTLGIHKPSPQVSSDLIRRVAMRSGQQEVFISLYCTDGMQISAWEKLLINLPKQTSSRPIYANEADVRSLISSRDNAINEAYASFFIDETNILSVSPENQSVDKLGHVLLILKDNAVNLKNIHYFMHGLQRYEYSQGKLLVIH